MPSMNFQLGMGSLGVNPLNTGMNVQMNVQSNPMNTGQPNPMNTGQVNM